MCMYVLYECHTQTLFLGDGDYFALEGTEWDGSLA